jgi:hypothetical protein
MPHRLHPMNHTLEIIFLALQAFNVAFLFLHDWIPLGRFSNLAAIRSQDTWSHRAFVTLLPGVPAFVCLFYSASYFGQVYPHWLDLWLWIMYGLFFLGLLRAWWIPYLFKTDAQRAARYQIIFANTHKFLPMRNGMAPDTLHTVFHLSVAATLIISFRDLL